MTTAILTANGFERVQPFDPNTIPPALTAKLLAAHRAVVRVGAIAAAHGNEGHYYSRWFELLNRRDDLIYDIISLGGYTREAVRAVLPSAM